jgi:RTX calcium-binding nonapeptide repeat (4 copies)
MSIVRAARGALPVALLLILALPVTAHASATLSSTGGALTFTATDSLDHLTEVVVQSNGHLTIADDRGITVGAGCSVVDADTADCGLASSRTQLTVTLAGGNDRLYTENVEVPMAISGGAGNDDLYGGGGADHIAGGAGSDEIGGGLGADTLDGGDGDDAVGAWDEGADVAPVTCGAGSDTVDFDYGLDVVAADCELRPPHLEEAPAISGQPTVGSTLTRTTPRASGGAASANYTYWERCDAWGLICVDVNSAQDDSHTVSADDVGMRIRVIYYLCNDAGCDGAASDLTAIVGYAQVVMPTAPPPLPRATLPVAAAPKPAFEIAGKAAAAMSRGAVVVDTGRRVTCPSGPLPCALTITARASGRAIAGNARVTLAAGKAAKVNVRLTPKTARLLEARRTLKLSVSAVLARGRAEQERTSFAITIKAPKRGRT